MISISSGGDSESERARNRRFSTIRDIWEENPDQQSTRSLKGVGTGGTQR
jgi:hypothetical protein